MLLPGAPGAAFLKDQAPPPQSWGPGRAGLEGAPGLLGGSPGVETQVTAGRCDGEGEGESPHGVSAYLTYLIVSSLRRQQHPLGPILPEH